MNTAYAALVFTCACLLALMILHWVFAKCSKETEWAFALDCAAAVTVGVAWLGGMFYYASLLGGV